MRHPAVARGSTVSGWWTWLPVNTTGVATGGTQPGRWSGRWYVVRSVGGGHHDGAVPGRERDDHHQEETGQRDGEHEAQLTARTLAVPDLHREPPRNTRSSPLGRGWRPRGCISIRKGSPATGTVAPWNSCIPRSSASPRRCSACST